MPVCQLLFPNLRHKKLKFPVFFCRHIPLQYIIMHYLQQHNMYTSSGPVAKVSTVKREKRKVKEKKGE